MIRPSRWELAAESLGEAIEELPETIGHAGKAVKAAGGFLRDPLKLGAAIVGAVASCPATSRIPPVTRGRGLILLVPRAIGALRNGSLIYRPVGRRRDEIPDACRTRATKTSSKEGAT
jgi:hypothetical protein